MYGWMCAFTLALILAPVLDIRTVLNKQLFNFYILFFSKGKHNVYGLGCGRR